MNDIQLYAERKTFEVDNENWRSVSQLNETVRVKVREWMRVGFHGIFTDVF